LLAIDLNDGPLLAAPGPTTQSVKSIVKIVRLQNTGFAEKNTSSLSSSTYGSLQAFLQRSDQELKNISSLETFKKKNTMDLASEVGLSLVLQANRGGW